MNFELVFLSFIFAFSYLLCISDKKLLNEIDWQILVCCSLVHIPKTDKMAQPVKALVAKSDVLILTPELTW